MYEVFLERAAERDLKRISVRQFHRIISEIKSLSTEARPRGCRKISGSENDWRIRIGDYRVVYEIDDKEKVVRIMRVKHRRDVYR